MSRKPQNTAFREWLDALTWQGILETDTQELLDAWETLEKLGVSPVYAGEALSAAFRVGQSYCSCPYTDC